MTTTDDTIGTALVVAGIPCRNEAATVATVAGTADAGLASACPAGANVIILAENGSTDGTVDGRKLHNSPFPKILHLPQQVLDSLFHVIARADAIHPPRRPVARPTAVDDVATPQDPEVVARIIRSTGRYVDSNLADIRRLFPSARALPAAPWGLLVTAVQWPWILADALQALALGEFERSRDHLVALCVNRVMTFWDEITT